LTYRSKIIKI